MAAHSSGEQHGEIRLTRAPALSVRARCSPLEAARRVTALASGSPSRGISQVLSPIASVGLKQRCSEDSRYETSRRTVKRSRLKKRA